MLKKDADYGDILKSASFLDGVIIDCFIQISFCSAADITLKINIEYILQPCPCGLNFL